MVDHLKHDLARQPAFATDVREHDKAIAKQPAKSEAVQPDRQAQQPTLEAAWRGRVCCSSSHDNLLCHRGHRDKSAVSAALVGALLRPWFLHAPATLSNLQ